jgi:peptide chain release factor 2
MYGSDWLPYGGIFDIDAKRQKINELQMQAALPDFWNERERAQEVLKEQRKCQSLVQRWDKGHSMLEDAETLVELAAEARDDSSLEEVGVMVSNLVTLLEKMEFERMLSGENDRFGALLNINSGAGGTESQDWAEMLFRMYGRWSERKHFNVQILDRQAGEEAGIKSTTVSVEGEYAFGYLKAEAGVHRLVRISPFDANARRHTSFASVSVYPDVENDVEIEIKEEDLKIDVFRAGGAGGQHVNKTESAVRMTHLPTGIVVQCQNERSQHKNKSQALRVLKARLYEHEMKKREEEMSEVRAQKKAIEWGSQIRSYVLAPYRLVTDHRTELKVGNVDAVLDGDLDQFIEAYLLSGGTD